MNFEIPQLDNNVDKEAQAESDLDKLLDDPEYAFLSSIPANEQEITNAATAVEALAFARRKIDEREKSTLRFEVPNGVEVESYSYRGLRKTMKMIVDSAREIGVGGDAYVVVAEVESVDGVSEVCYKFAHEERTPRGRNAMEQEMTIHGEFYDIVSAMEDSTVGVPKPYYYIEMGGKKMFAMERLRARSVDDLLRGFGSLPEWFDDEHVDSLCDGLTQALDACHAQGLYHRDLHFGNIMVTQSKTQEKADKLGYIIDFGLSAKGIEGMDPYKKETAGQTFTYGQDYGRINSVRNRLKELKLRSLV
jgi:serine/threonine protein kinase